MVIYIMKEKRILSKTEGKKKYQPPTLSLYGSVALLSTSGTSGPLEGGTYPPPPPNTFP